MSYTKPGVTVRQVQVSQSFPLATPELKGALAGKGYFYLDPENGGEWSALYGYDAKATPVLESVAIDLTELVPLDLIDGNIVAGSVVVYLKRAKMGTSGEAPGTITILAESDYTLAGNTLTIKAPSAVEEAEILEEYVTGSGTIHVGMLIDNTKIVGTAVTIEDAPGDISTKLCGTFNAGPSTQWFNPLAYCAYLHTVNGNTAFVVAGSASSADSADAASALELDLDVYSIAAISDDADYIAGLEAHAVEMSLPANKGERIVIGSRALTYTGTTSEQKSTDATSFAGVANAVFKKRAFNVYPPVAYLNVTTSALNLKGAAATDMRYLVFGQTFATDYKPVLVNTTVIDGVVVNKGTVLTEAQIADWITDLQETGSLNVNVLVPVPGYYLAAALSSTIVARGTASSPLTNSGIAGFVKVEKSNDYFKQGLLNTIAGGGNWIFETKGPGAVVTRHQVSTDMSSIETRELSITTAVDYAAKKLRASVEGLIGKFNISPSFIKSLKKAFITAGKALVEDGVMDSVTILKVEQDANEPDTINAEFDLGTLYPLNHIKITLKF